MKKYLFYTLIIVFIAQLLVPSYMIWNKYDILKTGQEYKFKVNPVDPYDAFRGRYVSLGYIDRFSVDRNGKYGVIAVGEDGFAKIEQVVNVKPIDRAYVKSKDSKYFYMPIDRYYMDEKLAHRAETLTRQRAGERDTYATVRIKNGNLVIKGLFIDDVAIEDIIKDEIK